MRKENSALTTKFLTEPGQHLRNDDYFAFVELDDFACYVMADGIDSQGLSSARIAIETIISRFTHSPGLSKRALGRYLRYANNELLTTSKSGPLRASLTIILTDYRKFIYGVAGNTRLLHIRGNGIATESRDLSLSQRYVDDGRLSKDKLARHTERNNLSCYVGQRKFDPFISKKMKLADGDILTLYTRGFWEQIDSGEILDATVETKSPQELLDAIEELLLSKQPESLDNYSIAAIYIEKVYQDAGKRKKNRKILIILIIVLAVIILALAAFFIIRGITRDGWKKELDQHMLLAVECIEDENYPSAKDEYKGALELAKKLDDTRKQSEVSRLQRMTEQILQADADLEDKRYEKALDRYDLVLKNSYLPEEPERSYVQSQRQRAADCMEIYDLLSEGDDLRSSGDLNAAIIQYRLARRKASTMYFIDGKKDCDAKISEAELERRELNDQAAEVLAQREAQDQAAATKAQEEAAAEEKKQLKADGMARESEADKEFRAGNFTKASDLYTMAQSSYEAAGESELSSKVQKKLDKTDEKLQDDTIEKLVQKGDDYETKADDLRKGMHFVDAKVQYMLALEKYKEAKADDEASSVQKKLDSLNSVLGLDPATGN